MEARDGLSFEVQPGDQALINFAGGLKLDNVLRLVTVRDHWGLGRSSWVNLSAAYVWDSNQTSVNSLSNIARRARSDEAFARLDLISDLSERNQLKTGVHWTRRDTRFVWEIPDSRSLAPWSALPFVELGLPSIAINPRVLRNGLSIYGQDRHRLTDRWMLEAGARLQVDFLGAANTYSLQAATSYQLRTLTILKGSIGTATQWLQNPLYFDPVYGNPATKPERVVQAVLGLEQPLPIGALLRIEGFGKWMDKLVVNPDSSEGLKRVLDEGRPAFQNVGRGFARGVDALWLGRLQHFSYGLALGLVFSDRTNPLADGIQTYSVPWEQRFSAAGNLSYTPNSKWIFSGRIAFHTGRPVTPVLGFTPDVQARAYRPIFGSTNSARYPPFYEASIRAERHFRWGELSMAWYAEVLNVTNAQNVFANIYSSGDFDRGELPTQSAFRHLPIRPFLGIRGEY
jgi:hypothetical protein